MNRPSGRRSGTRRARGCGQLDRLQGDRAQRDTARRVPARKRGDRDKGSHQRHDEYGRHDGGAPGSRDGGGTEVRPDIRKPPVPPGGHRLDVFRLSRIVAERLPKLGDDPREGVVGDRRTRPQAFEDVGLGHDVPLALEQQREQVERLGFHGQRPAGSRDLKPANVHSNVTKYVDGYPAADSVSCFHHVIRRLPTALRGAGENITSFSAKTSRSCHDLRGARGALCEQENRDAKSAVRR
jgi:hypothetical protein